MIYDATLGSAKWSSVKATGTPAEGGYDRSKVLAADMNGDDSITSLDASLLTDVTLFSAEIDQQTGEIIYYYLNAFSDIQSLRAASPPSEQS